MSDNFFEIGFAQHSGTKTRTQSDALWNGEYCVQRDSINTGKRFRDGADAVRLVVAKGISSGVMPQLASAFVAETLGALNPNVGSTAMTIREIHAQLCSRYGRGLTKGTATTVVTACLRDNTCQVASVGNCRAYFIKGDGEWTLLSQEHTYPNEAKKDGHLPVVDEEKALNERHPHWLIANQEETSLFIHCTQIRFRPGDSLLLCSDGLHDVLDEETIKNLYNPMFPPADQVEIWLGSVQAAGMPDNISIILARLNVKGHRQGIYLA